MKFCCMVNTGRQRPETEVTLKHKTELILYSYKNQQLQLWVCQSPGSEHVEFYSDKQAART